MNPLASAGRFIAGMAAKALLEQKRNSVIDGLSTGGSRRLMARAAALV
jgi:hypothetical protein